MAIFYFAWTDAGVAFNAVTHAVEEEGIFSFSLSQAEGEFATLKLDVLNPRAGLLNGDHPTWVWFSWDNGDGPQPLFYGRIVGIPESMTGEVVTLSFLARPDDYDARKAVVAETLKVDPFWDPVFVPPDRREDPDFLLESRPQLWHINRVTHAVSISDILQGEDGIVDFADSAFYDSVSMSFSQSPATQINVKATLKWIQQGTGSVDLSAKIISTFAATNPFTIATAYPPVVIASFTGGGLMSDWPKLGANIGGGWKVGASSAIRVDGLFCRTFLWDVPVQTGGLSESGNTFNALTGTDTVGGTTTTGTFESSFYGGSFGYVGAPTISQFPLWAILPQLSVEYAANMQRVETIAFSVFADVQPIVTDTKDDLITVELTSAEVDQPVDPGGALPIYDTRRSSYMLTDRGKRSLRYLIALARARLLARARAVRLSFEHSFEAIAPLTLRNSAAIADSRIPGGGATGKVVSYALTLDGSSGEMKGAVTLACTIGYGNSVEGSTGTGGYADDGVLDVGIQSFTGGATLVASDITFNDYDTTPIAAGLDLFNVTPDTAVSGFSVFNGPDVQAALLLGARTSGTGTGYVITHPGGYPGGTTTVAVGGGTGTILAGDVIVLLGGTRYTVTTGLSGGTISFVPPLPLAVPNGWPLAIDTTPRRFVDTNEATAALNDAHTQCLLTMVPVAGGEPLETPFTIVTSDLMVPKTIDLEADA